MKTGLLSASVLVLAAALTSPAAVVGPKATKWQTTLTSPDPAPVGVNFKITKTSKLSVKTSSGAVTFQLKLRGVTDMLDVPINQTGNTLQIDVLVSGTSCALMFTTVDIADGKTSQKFPVDNGSVACAGGLIPTRPMEIQGARVKEFGTGKVFGVAGVTAR